MSRTIALVACASQKRDHAAPAKDLYISSLFRKARAYAEQHDAWLILSAKHGVLHPDTITEPYDASLTTSPIAYRRSWTRHLHRALDPWLNTGDIVTALAGERYREGLEPYLRRRGIRLYVPMRGLGIGQQLAWLSAPPPKPSQRGTPQPATPNTGEI